MKESRAPFLESGLRRSLSTVCRGLDLGQVQEVWEENLILYFFNCLYGALLEKDVTTNEWNSIE
jgi:hypothetical protein